MTRCDRTVFLVAGGLCTTTAFALLALPHAVWATVLGWAMIAISISDMRYFIVPDWLSLPAIPIGLVATSYNDATALLLHVAGTMAGAAAFLAVRKGYFLLRGCQGLGLGDVKLAAVAGAWTGVDGFVTVVLTSSLMALSVVATILVAGRTLGFIQQPITGQTPLPYGAFLAPAIWLTYLWQGVSLF